MAEGRTHESSPYASRVRQWLDAVQGGQYARASSHSHALGLVALPPGPTVKSRVARHAVAPLDESRGARPTFVIEGVDVLVMELLAA